MMHIVKSLPTPLKIPGGNVPEEQTTYSVRDDSLV